MMDENNVVEWFLRQFDFAGKTDGEMWDDLHDELTRMQCEAGLFEDF